MLPLSLAEPTCDLCCATRRLKLSRIDDLRHCAQTLLKIKSEPIKHLKPIIRFRCLSRVIERADEQWVNWRPIAALLLDRE